MGNYTYTVDQLKQLQEIYLSEQDNETENEYFITERDYLTPGVTGFVYWLSEKDRTKLLK